MLYYKHHSDLPNVPDGCSNIACCQLPITTDEVFSADVCVTHSTYYSGDSLDAV